MGGLTCLFELSASFGPRWKYCWITWLGRRPMMAFVSQDKLGTVVLWCNDKASADNGGRLSRDSAGAKFGGETLAAGLTAEDRKSGKKG